MTLKFIDGFGSYKDVTSITKRWNVISVLGSSVLETGRVNALGNCLGFTGNKLRSKPLGDHETYTVGFAFQNVNLAPTGNVMTVLEFLDGNSVQTLLRFNTNTQVFSVLRGTTVLGTGTTQILQGVWYYIEMQVTANGTTGVINLKVNTTSELNLTAQNTITTVNNQINGISFRGTNASGGTGKYKLDDLYILDGSGNTNNDFLGDMKVETLSVGGPGSVTNWNPPAGYDNYQAVQNSSTSVYNSASGTNVVDTYSFNDLAKINTDIAGIMITSSVRNSDSTNHNIKSVARIGSTNNVDSSSQTVNSTAFQDYNFIWETDPDTGVAWTASGINAAEFGIDLVS